jgi:glycosyltransferase involved in cell wall biosynthesis
MALSVGVVIPVHNNARSLTWVLEALTPQLGDHDEVVVVDDHSHRPPNVQHHAHRVRLASLQRGNGPGNRSAARNEGWRTCTTDLVVFLDADMVPSPTFVDSLRRLHVQYARAVCKVERLALTQQEQARGKAGCLREVATVERWWMGTDAELRGCVPTKHWYFAASNALSVERRYVEEIGGWDEGYHGWGEEDMDFAYRLHQADLAFLFPEDRRLYAVHLDHEVDDDWTESLDRNARRFVDKFPEVYEVRLPAYRACGIALGGGASNPREGRLRSLAYSRRVGWG